MEEILEPEIKETIDRWTKINKENASLAIEELSQYRECIRAKKSLREVDINYVGGFYYELAWAYNICRGKETSKSILEEGREWYKEEENCCFDENFKKIYKTLFRYYADEKMDSKADEIYREEIHYILFYCSYRNRSRYNGLDLYSFYSIGDHHIEDLRDNQISLSDPLEFNDPVDCPFYEWLKQREKVKPPERVKSIREAYSDIRIRCFTSDTPLPSKEDMNPQPYSSIPAYSNPLMWAHYANSHRGYCVKYRLTESFFNYEDRDSPVLFLGEVSYGLVDMDVTKDKENMNMKEALFTKHNDWEYEHEKRLIYYDKNKPPETYQKVSMPEDMITDIYFGVRCKDSDKQRIIEALEERTVKYHQMKIDPKNLFCLKAVPLDPDKIRDLYSRLADWQTCWNELMLIKDAEPAE